MKTNQKSHFDPNLERQIEEKHNETKTSADKKGNESGLRNLPALHGDILEPFIGDIIAAYDNLKALIHQRLLPESHPINAKLKSDRAQEKSDLVGFELEKLSGQNSKDWQNLENFHPKNIPSRVTTTILATVVLLVGEIFFNSQAFQFFGNSLLFSLGISFALSFGVYLASHLVPMLYKGAVTRFGRWSVIILALTLSLGVFSGLAIMRSLMLAQQNISISPWVFVIFNMFFFIVSCVCSYYLLPSWDEIKLHRRLLVKYLEVKKRTKDINNYKMEDAGIRDTSMDDSIFHTNTGIYAKNLEDRVEKMCKESINIFISANLRCRPDKKTPDCIMNYYKNGGNSPLPPSISTLN